MNSAQQEKAMLKHNWYNSDECFFAQQAYWNKNGRLPTEDFDLFEWWADKSNHQHQYRSVN